MPSLSNLRFRDPLRELRVAPILNEIWQARAFTVGTVLGQESLEKLPSGHRRLPLTGNTPQLYGCSRKIARKPMSMHNSVKSVFELLEHRANKCSDRPRAIVAQDADEFRPERPRRIEYRDLLCSTMETI